jgi:hypothetical protein
MKETIIGGGRILDLRTIAEGRKVTIIEEYAILDIEDYIAEINLRGMKPGDFHGFVFKSGQIERETISLKSDDHWISLFVVKTDDKKYSWFIVDSASASGDNRLGEPRIIAYVHRFLGYRDERYDEEMERKRIIVEAKQERLDRLLAQIRPMVRGALSSGQINDGIEQLFHIIDTIDIKKLLADIYKIEYLGMGEILSRIGFYDRSPQEKFLKKLVLDLLEFKRFDNQEISRLGSVGGLEEFLSSLDRLEKGIYSDLPEVNRFISLSINRRYGRLIAEFKAATRARIVELARVKG